MKRTLKRSLKRSKKVQRETESLPPSDRVLRAKERFAQVVALNDQVMRKWPKWLKDLAGRTPIFVPGDP